jgi:arsenical pump membrane protein
MPLSLPADSLAAWAIAGTATAGVIIRPFRLPEATWAVAGAAVLVACGLLPWDVALTGVRKGLDVYLFLTGMMLIAELARREGLFDWLAAFAVEQARGSPQRLFALIYVAGTVVTVFLSNDATAVVLTPAVYAATQKAGARPMPYLLVCAFIANAASFVLPISNPANLVVFGSHMPHLSAWLWQFSLPSIASIAATYAALYFTQRRQLNHEDIQARVSRPTLQRGGRLTACGIGAIAIALLSCSALDVRLGLPTFICGATTTAVILGCSREAPWPLLRSISWSVLPLVAGLFVLVEVLNHTGAISWLEELLHEASTRSAMGTMWGAGTFTALACNVMNNLPAGLIAGSVVASDHLPGNIISAMLIGVDLGPNLSVTGSLATILWLVALRREKLEMGTWNFLRLGIIVMPPALMLSLAMIALLAVLK